MENFKDFVCGAQIDRDKSAGTYNYKGDTYHFCSAHCRDEFSKNPGKYIK